MSSQSVLTKTPLSIRNQPLTKSQQWLFVIFGLIVTILASSIKSVYQIYFSDLPQIYELSRTQVSLLGALFGLFVGIFSPFTGWLCDKYGASLTILSGIVVAIAGFYGIFTFDTLPLLILCFSVLLAYALTAMTFIPFGVLIDSIFTEDKKSTTYTVLANGTSIGFIVLSPLWVYLNGFVSWQAVNGYLSATYLIVLVPIGLYFLQVFPKVDSKNGSIGNTDKSVRANPVQDKPKKTRIKPKISSIKAHLFEKRYALLALSFGGCGMAMEFIDVHLVALLKTVTTLSIFSTTDTFVATSLSILGVTEILGSFLVLMAIKRFSLYSVLGVLYLIRAVTFLLMSWVSLDTVYIALLSVFGLTYMGTVIISSLLCLRWYGAEIKGRMFGMLFLVHQVFVFLSVWLGGFLFDMTDNYQMYIYALVILCVCAMLASFKLKSLELQSLEPTE